MNRLTGAGAAFYAGLGVVALARPELVPQTFGGTADTPDSRSEIRAVYGGLPLAIAGTLAACPSSATTMGVLTGGMAAGRAASALVERRTSPVKPVTPAFVAIEIAVAAALLIGGRRRCA